MTRKARNKPECEAGSGISPLAGGRITAGAGIPGLKWQAAGGPGEACPAGLARLPLEVQYAFWSRQTTARVLPMIMRSNTSDQLRM